MPRPFAHRCRAVAALSLFAAACSYPTDSSSGAWVKVHSPVLFVIRGADTVLDAHVYQLEHGKDTVEIKNVEITWATSDPQLATVTPLPGRRARVTGVNPGDVLITATAAAFESATAGADTLHVANPLEIVAVTPQAVKYGEEVTVFGVGAEKADVVFLGSQPLILNPFVGGVNATTGLGYRNFWVPFPVRSHDSVTVIGNGIVSQIRNPILVDETKDLFDPNMASPATIDIDLYPYSTGPVAVPTFKDVIAFYNPALYAEEPRGVPFLADWFRFASTKIDSAYTIVYVAPQLFGREVTYLSGPVTAATIAVGGSWTYGSGHYRCKGWDFNPAESPTPGFQVAFTKLPPGGTDLVSLFADRGQYQLLVVHGYFSNLRPDRFEGNNTCDLADANFVNPSLHIDLGAPFADTMTIDNPLEIDWYRFHVPGAGPQTVTVKLASKSAPVAIPNKSDIVLYVTNVPTPSVPLSILKSATTGGANKSLSVSLNPGDYYLVAHDSVGDAARYALCMAVGASCALPALPDVSAAAAPRLSKRDLERPENFQQRLVQLQADARKRRRPR
jgi:hypothetical protein